MVVLDASVVVKLFVPELLSEVAESIFERYGTFIAPDIIRIEVSSALTRKARNKILPADIIYKKLQEWKAFLIVENVQLIPSEELLEEAEKLSIELRHPLGDCLYLAAANQRELPLITADQPFIAAIGERFPKAQHLAACMVS